MLIPIWELYDIDGLAEDFTTNDGLAQACGIPLHWSYQRLTLSHRYIVIPVNCRRCSAFPVTMVSTSMHRHSGWMVYKWPCRNYWALVNPGKTEDCIAVGCKFTFNMLRPKQSGCRFADDVFKYIFLTKNIVVTFIVNHSVFVMIGSKSAVVQIMAWHRPGDKLLLEPIVI